MKIECRLKRPAPEYTEVELDGITYQVAPITSAPDAPHVAEVLDTAHIDVFLGIAEAYRAHIENRAPEPKKAAARTPMDAAMTAEAAKEAARQADADALNRTAVALAKAREEDAVAMAALIAKEQADEVAKEQADEVATAAALALEAAAADDEGDFDDVSDEGLAAEYKRIIGKAPAKTMDRSAIIAKIIDAAATKDD